MVDQLVISSQREVSDNLSSFLFNEVLSRILMRVEELGGLRGVKIARNCPAITHLMYTDDVVIFGRANTQEAEAIKDSLELFGRWSGPWRPIPANLGFLFLFFFSFSQNITPSNAATIKNELVFRRLDMDSVYLGLPMSVGRSKKTAFGPILEKVSARLTSWKSKVLSHVGVIPPW
ncbi:hypothetical protein L1049_016113 [Liquidambar formosana]|uniref:Reverse transcriptase n=1 Tax=Liquidambar formosana TaxID=63359 RepID=A0AAP0S5W3_LIQFO